ncbi:hypothetical protein KBZ17_15455 [Cyanobium sp. A2C-AMD]|nr:hypothetical protein [Cyanobium sp. A2C-AMD]
MSEVSIDEFRATLKVSSGEPLSRGEEVYSYWNNQSADPICFDPEEGLHIVRRTDGSFYLEIGNILHQGPLAELEEKLFEWAGDEGWFT